VRLARLVLRVPLVLLAPPVMRALPALRVTAQRALPEPRARLERPESLVLLERRALKVPLAPLALRATRVLLEPLERPA